MSQLPSLGERQNGRDRGEGIGLGFGGKPLAELKFSTMVFGLCFFFWFFCGHRLMVLSDTRFSFPDLEQYFLLK